MTCGVPWCELRGRQAAEWAADNLTSRLRSHRGLHEDLLDHACKELTGEIDIGLEDAVGVLQGWVITEQDAAS